MTIDWVALTSVVSSGVVAAGSLLLTYRGQKQQREHEAEQAYEGRVWDAKSAALYEVITTTRGLVLAMEDPSPDRLVTTVPRTVESLQGQVGAVEAYADQACRDAFTAVRREIEVQYGDAVMARFFIERCREEKEAAIDKQEFEAAAKARRKEKDVVEKAYASLTWRGPAMVAACEQLISEARANLRRSTTH